jgi:hypothetical protein
MAPTKHGFRAVLVLIGVVVALYLYLKRFSPGRPGGSSTKHIKSSKDSDRKDKKEKSSKAKIPHKYRAFVAAAKLTAVGATKSAEELEGVYPSTRTMRVVSRKDSPTTPNHLPNP